MFEVINTQTGCAQLRLFDNQRHAEDAAKLLNYECGVSGRYQAMNNGALDGYEMYWGCAGNLNDICGVVQEEFAQ